MADEEKPDTSLTGMQCSSADCPTRTRTRTIAGLCVEIPGVILGGILLYCLLTLTTIVVVSIFFLINTFLRLLKSMTGKSSHSRVVSPISDGGAAIILVPAIVFLSVSLGIVRAVESREHRVLSLGGGLHVGKWIEICMIFLGYCTIRIGVQILVDRHQASRPWAQSFVESIYCFLLFSTVLLVMKVVPSWEHKTVLGFPVWKLICAVVLVILIQSAINFAMLLLTKLSHAWCGFKRPKAQNYVHYYYTKGLRSTLVFVSVALMHLLTWRLYFRPNFLKHSSLVANRVSDFGTWTFVTELLCASLWLIKNFILLTWQAHTIYDRPKKDFLCPTSDKNDEILMRKLTYWCCLYYLGLIDLGEGRPIDKEVLNSNEDNQHQQEQSWTSLIWDKILVNTQEENNKVEREIKRHKWEKTVTTLIELVHKGKQPISIHTKQKIASAFLLDDWSLPEDHHISSLYEKLKIEEKMGVAKKIGTDVLDKILDECAKMSSKMSTTKTQENLGKILKTELLKTQDFQALTEKAQQNCLQFRYFLVSAQNVVTFLNRLMIGFVIILGILIWLLLTEILPTKVIVVIASPVLPATFIFGDTMKTVFQGIVFAYISHPFTVGHLCVIDKTQMEVKEIGIWRTTFSKLGTEEEVLYPNSDLAKKAIINHGSNLQLLQDDYAEFSLKYGTSKTRIKCLTSYINDLARQEKLKKSDSTNSSPQLEENIQSEIVPGNMYPTRENTTKNLGSASREEHSNCTRRNDDDIELDDVVVKQIEGNIKMSFHFKHDESILDMTNAQAFNEIQMKKSRILGQIADLIYKSNTFVGEGCPFN